MCLIPCRFHLRNIIRIRMYIPQDISIVLIKSLVTSRLDYSNGLLYGLPKWTVSGLQVVQNSAARIVTQERLRDHDSMSRALMELHWLPVDKRIEYKLLLYTYKAFRPWAKPWKGLIFVCSLQHFGGNLNTCDLKAQWFVEYKKTVFMKKVALFLWTFLTKNVWNMCFLWFTIFLNLTFVYKL